MSKPTARLIPVAQIEALLPQTQCGKCKHPGCRPYAEAIAAGEAINHCVPGGADTIAELAALLHEPVLPLDPAYGIEHDYRTVALIREGECIGCTKCIQACPVDAIMGAAKHMHTIITDLCTGCDLCVAPCPVDCIDMVPLPKITDAAEKKQLALEAKARYEARNTRLAQEEAERQAKRQAAPVASPTTSPSASPAADDKSRVIKAALARSNLKKAERRLAACDDASERAELEAEISRLNAELQALA